MHWFPAQFMDYNTRHKSLKQHPFVLNFLQISYSHSSHLCSHSNVPLSFPNIEPSVFWSTKMTANPNQHWGEENHTSVSRFVTGIVSPREPDNSGETPAGVHDLCKSLEGWFEW